MKFCEPPLEIHVLCFTFDEIVYFVPEGLGFVKVNETQLVPILVLQPGTSVNDGKATLAWAVSAWVRQ